MVCFGGLVSCCESGSLFAPKIVHPTLAIANTTTLFKAKVGWSWLPSPVGYGTLLLVGSPPGGGRWFGGLVDQFLTRSVFWGGQIRRSKSRCFLLGLSNMGVSSSGGCRNCAAWLRSHAKARASSLQPLLAGGLPAQERHRPGNFVEGPGNFR